MREHETENAVANMINNAAVGKELTISFGGIPTPVTVEFNFIGGWVVKHTIAPGMDLKFVKGEAEYLKGINITLERYEGLK